MHITHIHIDGFKRLADFDLELNQGVNVIVGPRLSGNPRRQSRSLRPRRRPRDAATCPSPGTWTTRRRSAIARATRDGVI